jgi:transposase
VLNRCKECFDKQQKIDKLVEENERLKVQLRRKAKAQTEGLFGSSTPSAKLPVKPNVEAKPEPKKRGAKNGHAAHARKAPDASANRTEAVPSAFGGLCPKCGKVLSRKDTRKRLVRECMPVASEDVAFELPVEHCAQCDCDYYTPAPSVFPKAVLGNQLVSNALEMTYLHGIPLGRVCEQLQVGPGALVGMFHRLAKLLGDVPTKLIELYRQAPVKHADETGWRTNGQNGYAWLFATPKLSIFQFEKTRAGRIAKAVFGDERLPGVLLVDRYAGYNKAPCDIQYCLAHLLREVQDTEKEFPDNKEVRAFASTVAPLIALAIGLRTQPISDEVFGQRAFDTASELKKAMSAPASHLAIRRIQEIFTDNEARLYHWARDRIIPADNNLAERDLRPTVIARKTSFGSQSDAGAKTRGVLMTVLHSLKKQGDNPGVRLKAALDALARDASLDPFKLLFPALGPPSSSVAAPS